MVFHWAVDYWMHPPCKRLANCAPSWHDRLWRGAWSAFLSLSQLQSLLHFWLIVFNSIGSEDEGAGQGLPGGKCQRHVIVWRQKLDMISIDFHFWIFLGMNSDSIMYSLRSHCLVTYKLVHIRMTHVNLSDEIVEIVETGCCWNTRIHNLPTMAYCASTCINLLLLWLRVPGFAWIYWSWNFECRKRCKLSGSTLSKSVTACVTSCGEKSWSSKRANWRMNWSGWDVSGRVQMWGLWRLLGAERCFCGRYALDMLSIAILPSGNARPMRRDAQQVLWWTEDRRLNFNVGARWGMKLRLHSPTEPNQPPLCA